MNDIFEQIKSYFQNYVYFVKGIWCQKNAKSLISTIHDKNWKSFKNYIVFLDLDSNYNINCSF